MYGIIGAMQSEVTELLSELPKKKEVKVGGVRFYTGKLLGKIPVVIAQSGVGKVNAAVTTAAMIAHFKPKAVINTGVSGALSATLHVKDLAIASELVQHDMDTTALGDPAGFVSGPNLVRFPVDKALLSGAKKVAEKLGLRYETGIIASGDQFICTPEQKERIRNQFGAVSCEMEGAAIAHACYLGKTPVLVIRTISDNADGSSHTDFPVFAAEAAVQSARVVRELLMSL